MYLAKRHNIEEFLDAAAIQFCSSARHPELVIAWHPEHLGKPRYRGAQHRLHLLEALAEIAAEDEPVALVIRKRIERTPVHVEADVDIAERKQSQETDST